MGRDENRRVVVDGRGCFDGVVVVWIGVWVWVGIFLRP